MQILIIYFIHFLPVNISGSPLEQILSDPIQLFGTAQRVERQFLHIILNQAILIINKIH